MTNTGLVSIFGFLFALAVLDSAYGYFVVKPKKLLPQKASSIVYTKGQPEFDKFWHLDGNLDGVITRHEINNYSKFTDELTSVQRVEGYKFFKALSPNDRMLLNGLSLDTAMIAHKKLTVSEKKALLKFNQQDRVNFINGKFSKVRES